MRLAFLLCVALVACDNAEAPPAEAPSPAPAPTVAPPEPELPARRFLEVTGTVKLDGKKVAVGDAIPEVGTVSTAKDGRAVMTLVPGSAIEIRPRTEMKLGSSPRRKISLQLLAGALFNILPKGSSFEVVTGNAVAGVRGTAFYIEAPSATSSYVCACDGTVELSHGTTLPRLVESDHGHKAFSFRGKGKKVKAAVAPRKNHTDEEVGKVAVHAK